MFIPSGSVVLQVADAQFLRQYATFMSSIEYFAASQGFMYRQVELRDDSTQHCIYTRKVTAVASALLHLPPSAWLWYFDTDVAFTGATNSSHILDDLLLNFQPLQKFHFVAQDSDHQINTGCFLIRNTIVGRALMMMWREKQLAHQPCRIGTSADQVTLQDAVLEMLVPDYGERHEPCLAFCGAPYCLNDCETYNCTPLAGMPWDWSKGKPFTVMSNMCYAKWMVSAGLSVNQRCSKNICLLPQRVRFNAHDLTANQHGYWYREGDTFFVPHGFFKWWKPTTRAVICDRLKAVVKGVVIPRLF